jgi:hypothetical protein
MYVVGSRVELMLPGTLPFVRLLQAFEMETVDSMGIGPITMP